MSINTTLRVSVSAAIILALSACSGVHDDLETTTYAELARRINASDNEGIRSFLSAGYNVSEEELSSFKEEVSSHFGKLSVVPHDKTMSLMREGANGQMNRVIGELPNDGKGDYLHDVPSKGMKNVFFGGLVQGENGVVGVLEFRDCPDSDKQDCGFRIRSR